VASKARNVTVKEELVAVGQTAGSSNVSITDEQLAGALRGALGCRYVF
jgi:hypothetical protein